MKKEKEILAFVSEKHVHSFDELIDELIKAGEDGLLEWALDNYGWIGAYFTSRQTEKACHQLAMIYERLRYMR